MLRIAAQRGWGGDLSIGARHPGMIPAGSLRAACSYYHVVREHQRQVPTTIGHPMATPQTTNRAEESSRSPIFGDQHHNAGVPSPQYYQWALGKRKTETLLS